MTDTGQTAPALASGDVMVPRAATPEMLQAAVDYWERARETTGMPYLADAYRAMIAAVPLSSAPRPSGDVAEKLGEIRERLDAVISQFGVAWAYESCGEKGDGSNIIGTMFHPDDENAERPLLGYCAPIYDEEARDFREYYRDELIAEVEHRNRGSGAIAEFISHAPSDIITLLERIATLEQELAGAQEMVGRKSEQYIAARKHADTLEQERTARDAECALMKPVFDAAMAYGAAIGREDVIERLLIPLFEATRNARRALGDQG